MSDCKGKGNHAEAEQRELIQTAVDTVWPPSMLTDSCYSHGSFTFPTSLLLLGLDNPVGMEVQEFCCVCHFYVKSTSGEVQIPSSLLYLLSFLLRAIPSIRSLVPCTCCVVNKVCCDPPSKSQMPLHPFKLRCTLLYLPGQPICLNVRFWCYFCVLNNWHSKHISRYWIQ